MLVLGVREIGEETELLPIGRVQFSFCFTFWRGCGRDIYCPLFKTWAEQRNVCKVLEDAWRQGRE